MRDDLVVGVGQAGMGPAGQDDVAVVDEVADHGLVHAVVGGVVEGVLVDGQEPGDVSGHCCIKRPARPT